MAKLVVDQLTVCVDNARLVNNAGFTLNQHEMVAIVGENGAGKSSLMRAIAGYIPVAQGTCSVDGRDLATLKPRERAQLIGWLPQSPAIAWPIRVKDAVALGRFPHGAVPWRMADRDARAIHKAVKDCQIDHLVDRAVTTLSGGELARVHIARALACDVSILLADEPVAALDPRHQMSVMHLFRSMVNRGGSALVILHDLTLAARFADRIIGMKEGRIVIDAKPAEVISPPVVRDLFGIEIEVTHGQGWPQPIVVG